MDTFERQGARTLAIAYHAYMDCKGAGGWQVWAKLLIQAQRDTGIELIPVSHLLYPAEPGAELAAPVIPDDGFADGGERYTDEELRHINGDSSGDGGALVPAPKPLPRKPSPGASVASQAAAFYAVRGKSEAEMAAWRKEHGE